MKTVTRRRGWVVARLLRDYARAAYYGADGRALRTMVVAMRVLRARFKHRIGPFHFSLFGLAHVAVRDWDGYIIMRPGFDASRSALSPGAIRGVVDDKILFHLHCVRAGLPVIPILCQVGGDAEVAHGLVEHATDAVRFDEILRNAPPELIVKPVNGAHGDDIFRVALCDGGFQFAGYTGAAADLFAYMSQCSAGKASLIVQPQVRPHAAMRPFASANGLPTARVVTAMQNGVPRVLMACLRIPVGDSVTDNFGDGTSVNLVAGIDVASGVLAPARGSSRRDWPVMVRVDVHPDSGCRIAGAPMPGWPQIVELALRAQRSLPNVKTAGWDVAVTTDGVVLVELNSNYGVYSLQVAYQRGLKAELAAQLNMSID